MSEGVKWFVVGGHLAGGALATGGAGGNPLGGIGSSAALTGRMATGGYAPGAYQVGGSSGGGMMGGAPVQEGAGRPSLFDPGAGALAENTLGDEYLCRTGAFNCAGGKPDGFKNLFVPEPGIPSPPVPPGASGWSRFWNWIRGSRTASEGVLDVLKGLRAGRSAGVKVVDTTDQLNALFGRLSAGGRVVQGTSYPGKLVELGDKTTVGLRGASKSGGPTIDVTLPNRVLLKVHIELPPGAI